MPIETIPFDRAQHLKTEADIARYLLAVLEANDPALHREAPSPPRRAYVESQRTAHDRQ